MSNVGEKRKKPSTESETIDVDTLTFRDCLKNVPHLVLTDSIERDKIYLKNLFDEYTFMFTQVCQSYDDLVVPYEPKINKEWVFYTPLKSEDSRLKNIAGFAEIEYIYIDEDADEDDVMRDSLSNLRALFHSYAWLMYKAGVQKLVSLELGEDEEYCWNLLRRLNPLTRDNMDIQFYDRHIEDMLNYTLENAMRLLGIYNDALNFKYAIHCTAGFGRTGSVMLLLLVYHKHLNGEIDIDDVSIYDAIVGLRDEFKMFYCEKSEKEMFDTQFGNGTCLLFAKRLNTIIAAIKTLNLQEIYDKSKDKTPLTDEIFLLNVEYASVRELMDPDYHDTSTYISKHTIHYPPIISHDYMKGGGNSKRSTASKSSVKLNKLKRLVFGPPKKWSLQTKVDVDLLTTTESVLRIKRMAENGRYFEQESKGYYIKPKVDYRRFDKIKQIDSNITRRRIRVAGKRKRSKNKL